VLGNSLMKLQEFYKPKEGNCLSLQAIGTKKPLGYPLHTYHKQPLTFGVKQSEVMENDLGKVVGCAIILPLHLILIST